MTELSEQATATRRLLLDAAQRSFAAGGFERTTLRDVTASAGMTTGAFYRYFPTKLDAFHQLYADYADAMTAALADVDDLTDGVLAWLRVSEDYRGTVRSGEELSVRDGEIRAHRQQLRHVWANSLVPFIRPEAAVKLRRALALATLDALDYYFFTALRGWSERPFEEIVSNLVPLVQTGLSGEPPLEEVAAPAAESAPPPKAPTPQLTWEPAPDRVAPRSRRGEAQRTAILDAATAVFAEQGYASTSVGHVAERAGVSPATVYRYFLDKRDIFLFLLARAEKALYERSLFGMGPDGRLIVRPAIEQFLVSRRRDVAVYSVWRELLDIDEEMERLWVQLREDFTTSLTKVIRTGQRRSVLRPEFNPAVTAELVVCLFDGTAHARYDLGFTDSPQGDAAVVEALTLLLADSAS